MQVRFLSLLRPAIDIMPRVPSPKRKVTMKEKLIWTGLILFIYLLCCQIPIYGVLQSRGADPLYWIRVILASNRGTLMELGISPIVTSSMVMQVLSGARILEVDFSVSEDQKLFVGAEKLLSLILTFGEAAAYIYSGMYGSIETIGFVNGVVILAQLTFAGIMVIMLDELLHNYGLGSGISLFIATNICENIFWRCFSPITLQSDQGTEFEGSLIAFLHLLLTKSNKLSALYQAFYRTSAPNLSNLLATVFIFFIVIYFQGFKKTIRIRSQKIRGATNEYPIKLFYTSNIPIILQTALVSNLYHISQILYSKFPNNLIVKIIGQWQERESMEGSRPVAGLAYYISPPHTLKDFMADPFHSFFYLFFVLLCCGLFARFWIKLSGESAEAIAKRLVDQDFMLCGQRNESMVKEFNRYIPVAATIGGVCIGLLTIIADLLGAIGSGTGILLAVSIIYGYFEMMHKDKENIGIIEF